MAAAKDTIDDEEKRIRAVLDKYTIGQMETKGMPGRHPMAVIKHVDSLITNAEDRQKWVRGLFDVLHIEHPYDNSQVLQVYGWWTRLNIVATHVCPRGSPLFAVLEPIINGPPNEEPLAASRSDTANSSKESEQGKPKSSEALLVEIGQLIRKDEADSKALRAWWDANKPAMNPPSASVKPQQEMPSTACTATSISATVSNDKKTTSVASKADEKKSLSEWLVAAKSSKQCISLGIATNVEVLTNMYDEYRKLQNATARIATNIEVLSTMHDAQKSQVVPQARSIIRLVDGGRVRVMTANLLALINCTPVFYPGCGMKTLWDLRGRLDTMVAWITKVQPHAIAFQEADMASIDYLSVMLKGSYTAGTFAPDTGFDGRLVAVGCVVFVHTGLVQKSSVDTLDGRGLALADVDIPGLGVVPVVAYKIGFKENGMAHVEKVVHQLWEKVFKGRAMGFLGTDSNMPAPVFHDLLSKFAPAFMPSLRLKDYEHPTFLHCEDLKKCGAIDAVIHFGKGTESSVAYPVFALQTPTLATDLPKACEIYQRIAGSDHVPVVDEITLSILGNHMIGRTETPTAASAAASATATATAPTATASAAAANATDIMPTQ